MSTDVQPITERSLKSGDSYETGRSFITRKKEHQKECEKETAGRFTQTQKQTAEQENLKSAITDHCRRSNPSMDWDRENHNT